MLSSRDFKSNNLFWFTCHGVFAMAKKCLYLELKLNNTKTKHLILLIKK